MKRNSLLIFVNLFFIYTCAQASTVVRVIKVRGEVFKLLPGAMSAKLVKLNDLLPEDTSLTTEKKSFVKLKFPDGTTSSLGPEGKMAIVKLDGDDNFSFVHLLKGVLRSQTKKDDKPKDKFHIKTTTAALAVRGTDFQTIYSPINKTTSNITFEGNVKMVNLPVRRPGEQFIPLEKEDLANLLDSNKAVEVKKGEVSSSIIGQELPTPPREVSKVQLTILEKNKDLVFGTQAKSTQETVAIKSGYVDLSSSLQINPTADVPINEIGSINIKTGEYIPPTGLKLDPVDGFVAQNNNKKEKAKEVNKILMPTLENIKEGLEKEKGDKKEGPVIQETLKSFKDFTFFPAKGDWIADSNLRLENSTINTELHSLQFKSEQEFSSSIIDLSLRRAVAENFLLGVELAYLIGREFKQTRSELSGSILANEPPHNDSGIKNPSLSLEYRLLKESSHKVNLDMGASHSFSIGDAEESNSYESGGSDFASEDGNGYDGGSSTFLSATATKSFPNYEFMGSVQYHIIGEKEVLQLKDGVDQNGNRRDIPTITESQSNFLLTAGVQVKKHKKIRVSFLAELHHIDENITKYEDFDSGILQIYNNRTDPYENFSLEGIFTYLLKQDMAFDAGLKATITGDQSLSMNITDTSTGNTTTNKIDITNQKTIQLRLGFSKKF